jgi:hypothetical protein
VNPVGHFLFLYRTEPSTLTNVIRAWIEPGTTLISDCWAAYRGIASHGYTHRTVKHSISFVNPDTEDHTNTIESMWRHVKAFLRPYNRQEGYVYHLAHYMSAARCKAQSIPEFLAIAASTDCSSCVTTVSSEYAAT